MTGRRWRLLILPVCALLAWVVIAPLAARGDVPNTQNTTVALSRSLVTATDPGVAPAVSTPSSTTRVEVETTTPSTVVLTTTTLPPDSSPLFEPSIEVLGATSVAESASAQDQLGARALQLMNYDWQRRFPDWTISFLGARSGLRALTYPSERRIEVFVRDQDDEQSLLRVIAHEVGHVVDVMLNNEADRERWRQARGLGATDWWPSEAKPDFATGAGDFAEAFAVWETGIRSRSSIAGQPTAEDLELLAELAN